MHQHHEDAPLRQNKDQQRSRQDTLSFSVLSGVRSMSQVFPLESAVALYRSKRWVVERTHSWMNRFMRSLML